MAKNWTAAEAVEVIREGKDLAAIQDIGRRFPIFAIKAGSGVEGLADIIKTLPENLTARKVEAVFKAAIEDVEVEDEEMEEEEKPKKGRGRKKKEEEEDKPARKGKGKGKKKPEPEPEPEEDDEEEDEEEEDYESMTLPQLRKAAKAEGIDVKGMKKNEIIAALNGELEDDEDDEEDEDDDDDWDI